MSRFPYGTWVALATVFTLLNALKPLTIDDPIHYTLARHIARAPLDPYGFTYDGVPANHVMVPPVLPSWVALGIHLFGDEPFLLKLWLWPFSLLFVGALLVLLRRFAPGLEVPLAGMTVLSPTFLPSLNLMLDVPVMALHLAAVALFLRAVDRNSLRLAVLAGLTAALALQTKYVALLTPAVLLLIALLERRPALGVLAVGLAALLFAGWEGYIASRYGESHFLHGLGNQRQNLAWSKVRFLLPLFGILGGLTPALILVGQTALAAPRRRLLTLGGLMTLGFVALAVVPDPYAILLRSPSSGKELLTLNQLLFGSLGLFACLTVTAISYQLLARPQMPGEPPRCRRDDLFLVCWLLLELAGYFALSPFPAARRVMGLIVVSTLLAGRLAARSYAASPRRTWVRLASVLGVVFGLAFYGVDWRDGCAERDAAQQAVRWIRQRQPDAPIYYSGIWGFAYQGERAGMKWLPQSGDPALASGTWVVNDPRGHGEINHQLRERGQRLSEVCVETACHLHTVSTFYAGRTVLTHTDEPIARLDIYRLR